LVEVLSNAVARIEQTDCEYTSNGDYFIYTLFIQIPLKLYAKIEANVGKFQFSIQSKLKSVLKNTGEHYLGEVVIEPKLREGPRTIIEPKVPKVEWEHLWDQGFVRLFISHVAKHKKDVSKLKERLASFGVSGFVAHQDVEPSSEWQREIELALDSMQAMLALITPDFHLSSWTDQELGFALGRGILVIPVRIGADPYGFIGKNQAVAGSFDGIPELAAEAVNILIKNSQTHMAAANGLV
jgi:hypothetical protein